MLSDFLVVGTICALLLIFILVVHIIEKKDREKRRSNSVFLMEPTGWTPMMCLRHGRQKDLFSDIPENHICRINNQTYVSSQAFDYIFKGKIKKTHRASNG